MSTIKWLTICQDEYLKHTASSNEMRYLLYHELNNKSSVPAWILERALQHANEDTVLWINKNSEPSCPFIEECSPILDHDSLESQQGMIRDIERRKLVSMVTSDPKPRTVEDVICMFIIRDLHQLEALEKKQLTAPVRQSSSLPRSKIAELIIDLFHNCHRLERTPGVYLLKLLTEFLRANRHNLDFFKEYQAREEAIYLDSTKKMSARELAEKTGVSHTTIIRWRKESEYKARVAENKSCNEEIAKFKY